MIRQAWNEKIMQGVFFVAACTSVLAVAFICIFLFHNGTLALSEIGIWDFLSGTVWRPNIEIFGIFPMIVGSVYITAGAVLTGVPIGIFTAVFMAFYCPKKLYRPLKASTDILAGIPSVVYGFFGLVVIVPLIRDLGQFLGMGGNGNNILTASILLGIMILPTVISVTEASLRAVPSLYYEGAAALGATHEQCIFKVVVPAAKSGILAAAVLGMGRAVGETMAVIMVAGNQARIPSDIFQGVRTLTANVVIEMGYAADLHRDALIATGVVLFAFILIINLFLAYLSRSK